MRKPEDVLGVVPEARHYDRQVTVAPAMVDEAQALIDAANEQLARDYADIEQASEALRRARPALQSWSTPSTPVAVKARPVWQIISIVWVSTAIVTVGAAVAIAALAG